jgi:hypothetical protein
MALLSLPAQANPSINSTVRGSTPQKQNQKAPAAQTASTPAKKLEAKPVFSAEDRQQIDDMAQKLTPETRTGLNKLSDSIHLEDRAVFNELRDDEEGSLSDIGMLWQAAVERSGTIRYAIEKLSRRDATGKPVEGDSFTKRALQNMVHLTGVGASMWTGTPAGLIGSNMVQDIMSGNPQDSALSRVTDADMVLLAKEVESLQSEVIRLYYNFKHAKERLDLAEEANSTIARYLDHADSSKVQINPSLQALMQTLYESTHQDTQNAQQAYNSAKTALALKVGPDAITALEDAKNKAKARAE